MEPIERPAGAPLVARMFGRFEVEINEKPVVWARRRDAQIFKYLLLSPQGRASRDELIAMFWSRGDAPLGRRSIRTAATNIRKAIGAIVGNDRVLQYFSSTGDLVVALDHAIVDVHRFHESAMQGNDARDRGDAAAALEAYRTAEWLYVGRLLSGEFPEAWYEPHVIFYETMYAEVLAELARLHDDAGRPRHAREYARRASELRVAASLSNAHTR